MTFSQSAARTSAHLLSTYGILQQFGRTRPLRPFSQALSRQLPAAARRRRIDAARAINQVLPDVKISATVQILRCASQTYSRWIRFDGRLCWNQTFRARPQMFPLWPRLRQGEKLLLPLRRAGRESL